MTRDFEKVIKNVKRFKVVDLIFGSICLGFGAYAECKYLSENRVLVLKPNNINILRSNRHSVWRN